MILFAVGVEMVQIVPLGKSSEACPQVETCQFGAAIGLCTAFCVLIGHRRNVGVQYRN